MSVSISFALRLFFSIAICLSVFDASAGQKLILIGGGKRPPEALRLLGDWAGQSSGRVLVISWATELPDQARETMTNEFKSQFAGKLEFSARTPLSHAEQEEFLSQLERATAVYFTGGNQNKIIAAFLANGGERIRSALKLAYAQGTPFAGTSAGTAIMSESMIAGDLKNGTVPLKQGLGLLPSDTIVDQHFSQRSRLPRLLTAQRQSGARIAFGVDEDTALVLRDARQAEVLGDHSVTARQSPATKLELLRRGNAWKIPAPQSNCNGAMMKL